MNKPPLVELRYPLWCAGEIPRISRYRERPLLEARRVYPRGGGWGGRRSTCTRPPQALGNTTSAHAYSPFYAPAAAAATLSESVRRRGGGRGRAPPLWLAVSAVPGCVRAIPTAPVRAQAIA